MSGVPQESILEPILSNLFFNDFFFCILISSAHNFADNNSLSFFVATVDDLIEMSQSECNLAIEWFIENNMFVNPDKFQDILLDKQKLDYTGVKLSCFFS